MSSYVPPAETKKAHGSPDGENMGWVFPLAALVVLTAPLLGGYACFSFGSGLSGSRQKVSCSLVGRSDSPGTYVSLYIEAAYDVNVFFLIRAYSAG